jgi:probable F420-dependent oxidoreductase
VELGLGLPTLGAAASPEAIVAVAEGAERAGLASVWAGERLLRPVTPVAYGGRGPAMPMPEIYSSAYDPLETLGFVAGRTRRIRLGTSVLDLPFHSPVVLAGRIATLDRLSGGRLVVGVGQGWVPEEFTAANVPLERRGARFEEHVAAMRAVWAPDPVRFDGAFYRIAASQIGPKPVQPGGPPLLAGAAAPAAIERAARMGLGLNPVAVSWEHLETALATFRRAAERAGRDPAALPVVVRVNGSVRTAARDRRAPLTGSVEQVAADVARAAALGVGEVFWAMSTPPEEQLEAMARLRDELGRGDG